MTEVEWFTCVRPSSLALHIEDTADPQRFHDLAMRWLNRCRNLLSEDRAEVLALYDKWLRGEGPHPRDTHLEPEHWSFEPLGQRFLPGQDPRGADRTVRALVYADNPMVASAHAASGAWEVLWGEASSRNDPPPDFDDFDAVFCTEFRDIAGNPFRPVAFRPEWRTEAAVALATGIDADAAFDRLPVLADALEEAGCDSQQVLQHCRNEPAHVRGCWVVDAVLGRC